MRGTNSSAALADARPPLLLLNAKQVPAYLKAQPQRWAPWKAVWDEQRGKYSKVPVTLDLRGASTHRSWYSFGDAVAAHEGSRGFTAGIGFRMTGVGGLVGLDLDKCVQNGDLAPWAAEIVSRCATYAERSPSGTGLRVFGLGQLAAGDWTNIERGIEVYGGGARFLTITGHRLDGAPHDVQPFPDGFLDELEAEHRKHRSAEAANDADMPELVDEGALPRIEDLDMSPKARAFLTEGEAGGDRSHALTVATVALYKATIQDAGPRDDVVLSMLWANPFARDVALDKRQQDEDRALDYIWRHHCLKQRGKALSAADDFEDLGPYQGSSPPLPAFQRDKKGKIEAGVNNLLLALRRDDVCGMRVGYDVFHDGIMLAPPGTNEWRPFTDADYTRLRASLERKDFKPIGRELIRDVVLTVAEDCKFDSAQLWLGGLPWDGVPRVESFLTEYLGVTDSPYARAVALYLWTALAGRVLNPGCKADMVPVFVGDQGIGKSKGAAALVPDPQFFVEISFQEQEDNLARKMRGRLLAEISELRGLHTRELETIKAFITRTHENWIPKYREFAVQFPRRLVFIGTTNQSDFLADETGERRWLPVVVPRVDVAAIERDRLQLWAEAREIYTFAGRVQFQAAEQLAREVHHAHKVRDSWEDVVGEWLDTPELDDRRPREREYLQVSDVLRHALGFDARNIKRADEMRIGKVLRALGYERGERRVSGKVAKVWLAPLSRPVATGGDAVATLQTIEATT